MRSMHPDVLVSVLQRLKSDYRFEPRGTWLREGKCPDCRNKSLFAFADSPWVIRCGKSNNCGSEWHIKDLYPELFEDWSERYKRDDKAPNAAADQYLIQSRGLDIARLKGRYTEETYRDNKLGIGSATVRFPITADCWWERIIDRPGRFGDKKANFSYGSSYRGHAWLHPDWPLDKLATVDDIWLAEGIFDSASLVESGVASGALMSTNNWPENFLRDLRMAIAAGSSPQRRPRLVFAFDVGAAGVDYARKYVARASDEGWDATAAQVVADGEGEKLDWNDLHQRDRLGAHDREQYLWAGSVTLATDPVEKAHLIRERPDHPDQKPRTKPNSFPFTLSNRTYWASFRKDENGDVQCNVSRIANCSFRILYRERDEVIDETNYYLNIKFPGKAPPAKGRFSSSALTASAEFKKRLFAWGAMWTGSGGQLDRIVETQSTDLKTVTPLDFTGYSRDHKAWVLGDVAVSGGKIIKRNAEDYFDIGKKGVKLRTSERLFEIDWKNETHDFAWYRAFATAFESKGLVTLGFWMISLFAEQIRDTTKALGFLEMCGPPGTGKSTILVFLWQLCGRTNYEGFDPAKATTAALYRNFASVGNFPIVLMEGDRSADQPHAKKFDFDELKPLWNGQGLRERGVRNAGNETYSPPFRGAVLIEQNLPVNGQPALLQRIMQIKFNTDHFSPETKAAVRIIENWPIEKASNFITCVIRRERELLDLFSVRFAFHAKEIEARALSRTERIIKNHAQLAAGLDMLKAIAPMSARDHEAATKLVYSMAHEREVASADDHEVVTKFWETFDYLEGIEGEGIERPLNLSRNHEKGEIAVHLLAFEARCRAAGISGVSYDDLKKHLHTSKARKFIAKKSVNPRTKNETLKTAHCWVFQRPAPTNDRII